MHKFVFDDISFQYLVSYNKETHFHFRAIDFQALIGNIGGYIGLCLGYSILQVPDFLLGIVSKIKKYVLHKQEKKMKVGEEIGVSE